MTTSGSVDFSVSRNDIINAALRLVGSKRRGMTLEAEETSEAAEALNMMVKAWQAQGYHLWKLKEVTLFLQDATQSFTLGSGHATLSYNQTTLSAAASSSDTTISVTSATGFTDTYNVGIELDDGSLQWTTVSGAPSGTTVTLAAGLTGDAASGNYVFVYQTKASRPLRVNDARVRGSDGEEITVTVISRKEYFDLTSKDTEGRVNQIYYDPQLDNGTLYVWPTTDSVKSVLRLTCYMPIEDFDASGNTPDFPQEWFEALKFGLASRLAPEKGLPVDRMMYLDSRASIALSQVLAFDAEEVSVFLQPA